MSDEQLIRLIKHYPILYDASLTEYADHMARYKAWEDIAAEFNCHVDDVKAKWAKLRNCYTNALKRRSKKNGKPKPPFPWKFQKQMKFLLPHIRRKDNDIDIIDDNLSDQSSNTDDSRLEKPIFVTTNHTPAASDDRTENKNNSNDALKEIVHIMKTSNEIKKRVHTEMDEHDHFFLSMSKMLKKLPKSDQVDIKFQVHKLIYDAEKRQLSFTENNVVDNKNMTIPTVWATDSSASQVKATNSPSTSTSRDKTLETRPTDS